LYAAVEIRAKLILYAAFVDGKLEAPRSLLSEVHRLYFQPRYEEFSPRTMCSLSNAFTSAFKEIGSHFPVQGHREIGLIPGPIPGITNGLSVCASAITERGGPSSDKGSKPCFKN
jgi:hypothetical protein